MSHFGVLVIVQPATDASREAIGKLVREALEPYQDKHWDWFTIGGRWAGHFDGYKPESDPANMETCDLCGGTGDRATYRNEPKEGQHPSGCNGCLGNGTRVKWPTGWAPHDGDIKPVNALNEGDLEVYAVCADYDWFGGEYYMPWAEDEKFQKLPLPSVEWLQQRYPDYMAVIVDCHN